MSNQIVMRDFAGDPAFVALVQRMLAPGEELVSVVGFNASRAAITTRRILKGSADSEAVLSVRNGAIECIEWFSSNSDSIMLTVKFGGLEVTILVTTAEEAIAVQQATALDGVPSAAS